MAALVNILSTHAKRQAGSLDYNSAPPNLSTLGNNTLFDTWRPRAHVLPPSNHIGDPCSELHMSQPRRLVLTLFKCTTPTLRLDYSTLDTCTPLMNNPELLAPSPTIL